MSDVHYIIRSPVFRNELSLILLEQYRSEQHLRQIDDRIELKFRRLFPQLLNNEINNNVAVQNIMESVKQQSKSKMEEAALQVVGRIASDDIHNNMVFGAFKAQMKDDNTKMLREVRKKHADEIKSLRRWQIANTVGLIGVVVFECVRSAL